MAQKAIEYMAMVQTNGRLRRVLRSCSTRADSDAALGADVTGRSFNKKKAGSNGSAIAVPMTTAETP